MAEDTLCDFEKLFRMKPSALLWFVKATERLRAAAVPDSFIYFITWRMMYLWCKVDGEPENGPLHLCCVHLFMYLRCSGFLWVLESPGTFLSDFLAQKIMENQCHSARPGN